MSAGWHDLRQFIDWLRHTGQLAVVDVPVDAQLEVAEIHRRVIAAGGPALLFTRVQGAEFPLVTNLFGTARRAEGAFGTRPLHLIKRLVHIAETLLPPTPAKLWGARDVAREALRVGLKRTSGGPVTEVVTDDVRLERLPALTCWPEDGGPFITLPLVYTEHPHRPGHNLGMYRLQVHGPHTTGMHWQIGKGGGFHYSAAEDDGVPLPVTVMLGGPPALMLAAIAPLPENVPELMLASLIAGERLQLATGIGPHPVVASAEFALMGQVPPHVRQPEGPFGDHYGYYSLRHDYPVFQVSRMAHRRDAIYPATVVGKPRQEDFFIGDLLQDLLSPLFPLVMPAVLGLWSYGETGYHSLAAAVVRERYRREALATAFRILGEGQLALTKFLFLTDRPVDLRDFRATLSHVLARTNPASDLYVFANTAMDTLDYTGVRINEGSKGVWLGLGDEVRSLPGTFTTASLSSPARDVHVFCPGCLVVGAPAYSEEPGAVEHIARDPAFAAWPLVVVSDEPRRAARSAMNFLWTTFTRFDPARDIHAAHTRLVSHYVSHTPPIVIDARMKPGYPAELTCRPDVAATVSRRWREYFPDGAVEMGDAEAGHLDR
ncbi:MAG: UbiD family decarboxylase [Vicinamibacterales bacterium]